MGKKLSLDQMELYRRCDEVLHYVWDPIKVSGSAWARDEYMSYLPSVFNVLTSGSGEDGLAEHLRKIETERMGLAGDSAGARTAAALLVEWRDQVKRR